MKIRFTLNGVPVDADVRADENLREVIHRESDVVSVRQTCGIGVCGTCTVLVDGETISSCLLLAPLADGHEITTVEGLAARHPVQRAFSEAHAFQCGYCTPGMILTAVRLLEENPRPTEEEIRLALAGNLCRCGCYLKIIEAVRSASA